MGYFVYVIDNEKWGLLNSYYRKGKGHIFSRILNKNINEGDTVYIYQKQSSGGCKVGFVASCVVLNKLRENKEKNRVFADIDLHRYICDLKEMTNFNTIILLSSIKEIEKNVETKMKALKAKFFSTPNVLIDIPLKIGECIESYIKSLNDDFTNIKFKQPVVLSPTKNEKSDFDSDIDETEDEVRSIHEKRKVKKDLFSDSESDKSSDISESDTESENSTSSDDSDNEISNVPVLMIPCKNFEWIDDNKSNAKEIIKHYTKCKKCDKTNNNNCEIDFSTKMKIAELDDEEEINELMTRYFNLTGHKIALDNTIKVHRISDEDHEYYKSIIILF
jgi:hypothetical protein